MTLNGVMVLILRYFTESVYDVVVKQLLGLPRFQNRLLIVYDDLRDYSAIIWAKQEEAIASTTSDCSCLRPCILPSFLWQRAGPFSSTAGWMGESTLTLGLMGVGASISVDA